MLNLNLQTLAFAKWAGIFGLALFSTTISCILASNGCSPASSVYGNLYWHTSPVCVVWIRNGYNLKKNIYIITNYFYYWLRM